MGAYRYYLRLDGVIGEVTAPGYQGWIEVFSASDGMSSSAGVRGGGSTSRTTISNMTFVMPMQAASANIAAFCAQARNINTAEFVVVKGGQPVIRITFDDVYISSFSISGNVGGEMADSFSIDFVKRTYRYMKEPLAAHVKPDWGLTND